MKKKLVVGTIIIALSSWASSGVNAYTTTGSSSVDGSELVYDDHASDALWAYADHAAAEWSLGAVSIFRDNSSSIEDVGLYTGNQDETWDAIYRTQTSPDSITVNLKFWQDYNADQRNSVMAHEFGHALGLGEEDADPPVLMTQKTSQRLLWGTDYIITPQQDDINGYWSIY